MYRSIPTNGARIEALKEMLTENGPQAVLEALELLAREQAAENSYPPLTASWTAAADEIQRASNSHVIAAL